jgi:Flp pilus assembly protein TadG
MGVPRMTIFSIRKNQCGATMLEFAIAGPVLLFMLLVTVDLLRLSYYTVTTRFVASRIARQSALGSSAWGTDANQPQFLRNQISTAAKQYMVPLTTADVVPDIPVDDHQAKGELFSVRINVPSQGLIWGRAFGNYQVRVFVIGRNEKW